MNAREREEATLPTLQDDWSLFSRLDASREDGSPDCQTRCSPTRRTRDAPCSIFSEAGQCGSKLRSLGKSDFPMPDYNIMHKNCYPTFAFACSKRFLVLPLSRHREGLCPELRASFPTVFAVGGTRDA